MRKMTAVQKGSDVLTTERAAYLNSTNQMCNNYFLTNQMPHKSKCTNQITSCAAARGQLSFYLNFLRRAPPLGSFQITLQFASKQKTVK